MYTNGAPVYPAGQPVYANSQPSYPSPVYSSGQPVVYAPAQGAYSGQPVYAADDYIYYPSVEVYYSTARREYIYRDGPYWVTRPTPPRYWSQGPYVHVQLHGGPQHYHSNVVRSYPRGWRPSYDYHGRR